MGFPVSCRSCFSLSPPLPLNEEPIPAVHQQVCLNTLSGPFVPGQHTVACTYLGRTLGVIFCKSMFVFCFCFFHLFFEWERGVQGGSVGGARPSFSKWPETHCSHAGESWAEQPLTDAVGNKWTDWQMDWLIVKAELMSRWRGPSPSHFCVITVKISPPTIFFFYWVCTISQCLSRILFFHKQTESFRLARVNTERSLMNCLGRGRGRGGGGVACDSLKCVLTLHWERSVVVEVNSGGPQAGSPFSN